jgi:cobalt-zinc-cadmium efflux system membrane fusion protein
MKRKKTLNAPLMILASVALVLGLSLFNGCGGSDEPRAEDAHVEEQSSGDDEHGAEEHETENGHGAEIELSAAEAEELGIEIATAGPGTIARTIDLPGEITLNGDQTVHIVPRVGGIVREVRGSLGDTVKEGELLAVIESRELADATAEYLASRERLALAGDVHDREEELWKKKISSEQEYLDAKQALSEARIAHRAAEQKLLALGVAEEALREMPAQVESDLTRYEIRSPAAGTLIHKKISLGEALEANTEIFTVADLGTVWIDISVYQKDLSLIREGQAVTITSNGGSEPVARGTIGYVGPVLEHETRTALARIILPNRDGALRPGTFIKAHIAVESEEVPVVVPRDALQTIDGETILFIPTDHGFEAHPVVAGRSSSAIVEIASGFEPGWSYVLEGAFELKAKLVTGSLDSHAGHGH